MSRALSLLRRYALVLAFAGSSVASLPALAAGWSFFLVQQALTLLSEAAFSQLGPADPAGSPPGWEITLGAAELLNEKLPVQSGDGFSFILARAPAPGALEIQAITPREAPTAAELDRAWGPGLAAMFCGQTPTLWARWIAIGGSVGLEVKTRAGETIRRYGVARSDCAKLARK